jgi:hypothetical protein
VVVRLVVVALLMGAAVGCHSASGAPQDNGSSGSAGSSGAGAAPLVCSDAGATGGIGGDGLPVCTVTSRPGDPLNADASADAAGSAPETANDDDDCNQLQQVSDSTRVLDCLIGPLCKPERFAVSDGGAVEADGGTLPPPTGGTIVDGDYQLVRYRSVVSGVPTTRRSIAIYSGGTYVEWAAYEQAESTISDSQPVLLRLNTTMSASGSVWTVASVNCGSLATTQYLYTANGTELDLYDLDAGGALQNVYTYQRTCSR